VTKLWGGRFSEEPAAELMAFTQSLSFDKVLVGEDCEVLGAHAKALARAGLLSAAELEAISSALPLIAAAVSNPSYVFLPEDEDVHTVVERELLARVPDAGAKVRAGLSRNDRVAAASRLWLMRSGRFVVSALCNMIETLALRARENVDTVMPGYTHLQRAQPVTLAHHLLAHAFAFERDARRFLDAISRVDASPLGAGALAGSTLGLAHEPADAGFGGALVNSIDAVASRDAFAEFLAAAAICGVHCSRLGEEIVLWTSTEFSFATLGDAFATGSSLMPQKKNPDIAELSRGKAGRLVGNLTTLLVTLKGLPLAYNRDLQEDKEPLFDSVRTLSLMLPALAGAVASLTFDSDNLARAASDEALVATDLADHLVRTGVSFRDAHERVGELVARAQSSGLPLSEVVADALGEAARAVLDARASVAARRAPGPNQDSVRHQLELITAALTELRPG
jgi:argininosuccinate lyase